MYRPRHHESSERDTRPHRDHLVHGRHAQRSRRSQEGSRITAPVSMAERPVAVNRSSQYGLTISHRTLNIRRSDAGRLSIRPVKVEYKIRGGDPMDRVEVEYEYGPTATSAHHTMGDSPSLNDPSDTDTNAGSPIAKSDVPIRSACSASAMDPSEEATDWDSDADTCLDSLDDENSLDGPAHKRAGSAQTATVATTERTPSSLVSANESRSTAQC